MSRLSEVWLKWSWRTCARFRYGKSPLTVYVVPLSSWTFCSPATSVWSLRASTTALSNPATRILPVGTHLPLAYFGIHPSLIETFAYFQTGSDVGPSGIVV